MHACDDNKSSPSFLRDASERWVRQVRDRLQGARVGGQWCSGAPSGGLGASAGCRPRVIVDVGDCRSPGGGRDCRWGQES
eukprot:6069093-Prymnesium_polylepis.1